MSGRDDLSSWSNKALINEVRRLRAVVQDYQREASPELEMESGVNTHGHPFVKMRWGSNLTQFTPIDARMQGEIFFDCAAAAEFDAALVAAFKAMDMDEETALQMLAVMRTHREDAAKEASRRTAAVRLQERRLKDRK
jgi:hypothetical protein